MSTHSSSYAPIRVRPILLLYCLSGLVSLGYQIVWFRIYAEHFGSTSLTFLLVLTSFIGGLGVGAVASDRICRWLSSQVRTTDGLRLYGVIELLVAGFVTLTVLIGTAASDSWGSFPYELDGNVYVPTLGLRLSQVGIAITCVFLPSVFMGVTFPLLCQLACERPRFPSHLYAWNTMGACSGVLLCQFVAIHTIGHLWTLWVLIAVNLSIGGIFLVTGGAPNYPPKAGAVSVARLPQRADVLRLAVFAGAGGLLVGALEGDLFKRLWFLGTNSGAAMAFISFWAILGIFLASVTVTRCSRLKLTHIKVAFVLACLAYAGLWKLAYPIRGWFRDLFAERLVEVSISRSDVLPSVLQSDLGFTFVFVGLFTFPAIYLLSLMLPFVCNALRGNQRLLGLAYGVNTLAFCVGMVSFIWLAPSVDIFYSLKLAMLLLVIGAVTLACIGARSRRALSIAAFGGVVFAGAALVTPRGYDRAALDPARQVYYYPVRALKSNGAHTTYVVEMPGGDALYFDSHPMSATDLEAQIYMRLMAHFPLLAQAEPKSALLIGFGVGNTASAIAQHDSITRLDIVDLNRRVIETAPEFKETNQAVYDDPRVRLIIDDGRRFLDRTVQRYDLITSEPPPPMQDGVYRLYSKEYYESALSRLTQGGMLTQWLPISQLSNVTTALMISTFRSVFSESLLFSGYGAQLILVGSNEPIDVVRLRERLTGDEHMVAEFRRLRMPTVEHLMARILKPDFVLDREYVGVQVISDLRNDLAFQVGASLNLTRLDYNPNETLKWLADSGVRTGDTLAPIVTHLGRLLYQLPDFPVNWLNVTTGADETAVTLADADWAEIVRLFDEYQVAVRSGDLPTAQSLLKRCLALAGEQPLALLALGRTQLALHEHREASRTLEHFLAIEPNDPIGHLNLGYALLGEGQVSRALKIAQRTVVLAPDSPWAFQLRGQARRDAGKLLSALQDYERARKLAPDDISLLREQAALLELLRESGDN